MVNQNEGADHVNPTVYEDYIITFDGIDLHDEYFSKNTQFWLDYIKPKMIVYNHFLSQHPVGMKIEDGKLAYEDVRKELFIVGEITDIEVDEKGIKAKYVLYNRLPPNITSKFDYWDNVIDEEHQYWLKLVQQRKADGKLGFSSDAMRQLVERKSDDQANATFIKSWAMPYVSLTHIPAEPRNNSAVIEDLQSADVDNELLIAAGKSFQENKELLMDYETTNKPVVEEVGEPAKAEEPIATAPPVAGAEEPMQMEAPSDPMTQVIGLLGQIMQALGTDKAVVEEEQPSLQSEEAEAMQQRQGKLETEEVSKSVEIKQEEPIVTVTGAGKYAGEAKNININILGGRKDDDETRFVKAIRLMRDKGAGAATELKALGLVPASSGGFTTQIQQSNELIDLLLARSIFMQGGEAGRLVDFMPMMSDTLTVPVLSGGSQAYWIGENSEITASEPAFEQRQLVAHKIAALIPISNELLADNSIQLESKLREHMVRIMYNTVDKAILAGTGLAGQPLGVRNHAGVTQTALNAVPTYSNLVDVIERLESSNVELDDSVAWLFNPTVKSIFRKMVSPANDYIWTDMEGVGAAASTNANKQLLGYKWMSSTNVEAGLGANATNENDIYFGRWRDVIVGMRSDIELKVSDTAGTAFANDQTWIRAIMRMDVALAHPESIQILTEVRRS